ncbi:hypothetical protein [Jiangella alba]|uniref:PH domain-containing protein n=1 Tax=Jiangella alba TaxID=561176 RepID=A0A1H5LMK1_9ACTN|nr:hypothetical protein [Jiangella alba]SEE78276.1 hypothetical protein SAMN04488561_2675 [Jiangella alba]
MSTTLVLRPAPGPRRHLLSIAAVIAVVLVIAGALAGGRPALITGIALAAVVILAAAAHLWRSRIVAAPAEISARWLFGRRRQDRADAASVVLTTLIRPGAAARTVFVLGARDQVLMRINGALYAPEDLDRLVEHLELPLGGPDDPVTGARLARAQPGAAGWIERHPAGVILICIAAFIVIAVVGGALLAGL